MWLAMIFGGFFAGLWLDAILFPVLYRSLTSHLISFAIGLWIARMVINASRNTGRYLNRNGRVGDIPRLETNRLVVTGYYSCMRHPMHLGLLLFPFAAALLAGSPSFLIIIAPFEALLMIILIKTVEEPQALQKFGEDYRKYMAKTPMFSFKKECLRMLFSRDGYKKISGKQ